jgi:hypothetical protein
MKLIGNGFTVEAPGGWQDRTITTILGPPGPSGFAPNVVMIRDPLPPSVRLEDYARSQLERTIAEVPGLEVLSERTIDLNGIRTIQRLQRFSASGRRIQQSQIYALGASVVLAITCSAQQEEFAASLAAFEKITSSLAFFDPDPRPTGVH